MAEFDAIVVGAGPSGMAAAYTMAKAGLKVIAFERGEYPGSKNVMGGVLYRHAMEETIPEFWKEAPLERRVVAQNLWVLSEDSAVTLGHRSQRFAQEPGNCFTVLRAKFDRWFARKAEEIGVLLICETLVEELIKENGRVVGVRTGRAEGDLYAGVVVIADGVNSLLAKKAGFHTELAPQHVALAVKEVIALPREKIQDRFHLQGDEGATVELVGEATAGMYGTGFIYTNRDSLSVGVGAALSHYVERLISPNDLLERMKRHPVVRPLLEGGTTREYLGHLIPEGGYRAIPQLCGDGFLLVGDAAMLVNPYHREGSNLALTSGRLAGETVIEAKAKGDFSLATLSGYQRKLEESYIIKDLKKYRDAPAFFQSNPHFFSLYPKLANEALSQFLTVDGVPKGEKQKMIWQSLRQERGLWPLALDMFRAWRVLK